MKPSHRGDRFARFIAILVFLIGVVVILWVVWLALEMFRDPSLGKVVASAKDGPSLVDVSTGFFRLLLKIALLALGSVSGSLIANKGINLYFSVLQARNPESPPTVSPTPAAQEKTKLPE